MGHTQMLQDAITKIFELEQRLQQAHRQGWEQAKREAVKSVEIMYLGAERILCGDTIDLATNAIANMEYKGLRMTDNEKLARWQGARDCRGSKNNKSKWKWPTSYNPNVFYYKALPDYLNDDAAAMSLLNTLVKKGYEYELQAHYCYNAERVMYRLKLERIKTGEVLWVDDKKYFITRREAVVAACLELIEKEASHDV